MVSVLALTASRREFKPAGPYFLLFGHLIVFFINYYNKCIQSFETQIIELKLAFDGQADNTRNGMHTCAISTGTFEI